MGVKEVSKSSYLHAPSRLQITVRIIIIYMPKQIVVSSSGIPVCECSYSDLYVAWSAEMTSVGVMHRLIEVFMSLLRAIPEFVTCIRGFQPENPNFVSSTNLHLICSKDSERNVFWCHPWHDFVRYSYVSDTTLDVDIIPHDDHNLERQLDGPYHPCQTSRRVIRIHF